MSFEEAKIINQKKILDHLIVGHPYYPPRPAFLLIKNGNLKIREQISIYTPSNYSVILIDSNSVYEILEYSHNIDALVVVFNKGYFEKLNLKFNHLSAFRNIRSELKKGYQCDESDFFAIWNNIQNVQYYTENKDEQEYTIDVIESLFSAFIYQLANIVTQQREISKEKMSRSQEVALNFIKLVSANFKKERSVEFYAQKMMLSSRHLTVVLKEIFGKSAIQIINEFILNEAKAQLSSSSKPINEIASQLQFSDQYSFSHFFKKHENLSPKEYRNQF
ncbi:helix-turn-helix domain-containing protein [Soonwooa purpurea]